MTDNPQPRVLLIATYFPPGASSGTLRTLKFAHYLPEFGWTPQVLTMAPESYLPSRIDYSLMQGLDPGLKVHRAAAWMPERTLARWYKRLKVWPKPSNPSSASPKTAASGAGAAERKRRFLISDLLDWMHFPDDYGGWLFPGTRAGRKVLRQENIGFLYSTSPSPVAHLIAQRLKRSTGLPWIADFRDPWEALFPECFFMEEENRLKHALEIKVGEKAIAAADLVIANTESARVAFVERFPNLPKEKFVTLSNGFDPKDFENISPTLCEGEKLTFTHAGTFFPGLRTPDEILTAFGELIREGAIDPARVTLKFVGCGPFSSAELPTLEVVPRVSHAESLRIMAESDVLLLPQQSDKYNLMIPAKAYEYMAVGKWVLAIAPDGATAGLVKRMPNGIVVAPGDKQDLKARITAFYTMFLNKKLYPVPRDQALIDSYTRREQTGVLARWMNQLVRPGNSPRVSG